MLAQKAAAFLRRDFRIDSSYKFAFVFDLLTTVFPLLSFYFIGRLVSTGNDALGRYGGEYFPFAMIGVAFTQYFMMAVSTFSVSIRRAQMAGCLEAMLSTRTEPQTVIVLSALYSFLARLIHIAVAFAIGALFLGVDFSGANFPAAALILVLTVLAFSAVGICSSAFIIVLKKGDPIGWLVGSLSALLGGALFPIDLLPNWLQKVSAVLPITYSLRAMRLAMLADAGWSQLAAPIGVLGLMAVLLLPVSIWVFSRAVGRARRDGTLMHY